MMCFFSITFHSQEFACCHYSKKNVAFGGIYSMLTSLLVSLPAGVLPYKGLMGTCGQPGYVFRDFVLNRVSNL